MRVAFLVPVLGLLALTACENDRSNAVTMTFSGPTGDVARFIESQTGRNPAITVSEVRETDAERSAATLSLPTEKVVDISRRAAEVRLSYQTGDGR